MSAPHDLGPWEPLAAAIVDRVVARLAPDELLPIDDCGVERAAVLRLIASGELRARKLGRRRFVLRSDLCRLISAPRQATEQSAAAADDDSDDAAWLVRAAAHAKRRRDRGAA